MIGHDRAPIGNLDIPGTHAHSREPSSILGLLLVAGFSTAAAVLNSTATAELHMLQRPQN